MELQNKTSSRGEIAIVGMSVCLPGAPNAARFWSNLRDGVESIHALSDEMLAEAGERDSLIHHPDYVKAAATLDGYDEFDARAKFYKDVSRLIAEGN